MVSRGIINIHDLHPGEVWVVLYQASGGERPWSVADAQRILAGDLAKVHLALYYFEHELRLAGAFRDYGRKFNPESFDFFHGPDGAPGFAQMHIDTLRRERRVIQLPSKSIWRFMLKSIEADTIDRNRMLYRPRRLASGAVLETITVEHYCRLPSSAVLTFLDGETHRKKGNIRRLVVFENGFVNCGFLPKVPRPRLTPFAAPYRTE